MFFLLLFFSVISLILLFFIKDYLKPSRFALGSTAISFLLSLSLYLSFDFCSLNYHFFSGYKTSSLINFSLFSGLDPLSLFFLLLTTLLIPFCLLVSWNSASHLNIEYNLVFLLLNFILIIVFASGDLFLFYISFEAVLIPMFFLISVWGSRDRKVRASYLFFFYTLVGSIFMLLGIIYMYCVTGSSSFSVLSQHLFTKEEQVWLLICFFLSLASKIPLFPFHIWLPEAHVEAPTAGSVILAGVLLKLGSYGFLRYTITLFPEGCYYLSTLIFVFSILGVFFGSLSAIRQTDFKRIIAYSSVAHMNMVVLGIFSFVTQGFQGAIFQSVSHGFVASALFLLIGVIYDRVRTREIFYLSGLVQIMPVFSLFFLLFTLANIALPGTSSFVGEFTMMLGIFASSSSAAFLIGTSMVLGGAYSLWLYNRVIYGNLKLGFFSATLTDLTLLEFSFLAPLAVGVIVLGISPDILLSPTTLYSYNSLIDYVLIQL